MLYYMSSTTASNAILTNSVNAIVPTTGDITISNLQTVGLTTLGNIANTTRIFSGTVDIQNVNSTTGTVNIKNGTDAKGSVNIASGAQFSGGGATVSVNIGGGSTNGPVVIGNTNNITQVQSDSFQVVSAGTIVIKGQDAATNSVRIATGGGTNSASVSISTGSTTGAVTIGNPSNTVQVNGTLTMGTGRNITLQPSTGWTAPSSTQLGYSIPIPNISFSSAVSTGGTATAYSSGTFLENGTYIASLYAFSYYSGTITTANLNFKIGIISSATTTPSGTTTLFNTTTSPIKNDTTFSTNTYFPTYVFTVITSAYYFGMCSATVTIVGGGTATTGCQITALTRIA